MLNGKFESLDGGTTTTERRTLCRLASSITEGQIVEIGSYVGGSTIYLAEGAKLTNKKVYAVDPHPGGTKSSFLSNISKAHCEDVVIPIVMKSQDAAKDFNQSIGLLYIDGLHDYENARADFFAWKDKLVPDTGVIVFHDCWHVGVSRVISEMLGSGQFSKVKLCQGLFQATSTPASLVQRLFKYRLASAVLLVIAYTQALLISNVALRKLEHRFRLYRIIKKLVPRI